MMSEGNSGYLQPEGGEDNVGKRGEKVNCNGEVLRTSDPLKEGSTNGDKGQTDTRSGEGCSPVVDTQWVGDEQITSNSKDPTHNGHNSESTSSDDEGDFAANWYEPLPQDPRESDEEEEREKWSEATTGSQSLQGRQDGEKEEEEEGKGQSTSVQQAEEVKAASLMEDSEL